MAIPFKEEPSEMCMMHEPTQPYFKGATDSFKKAKGTIRKLSYWIRLDMDRWTQSLTTIVSVVAPPYTSTFLNIFAYLDDILACKPEQVQIFIIGLIP